MLELASLGAKVLQTRSVELAMRYKVRLRVLSSFEDTDENSGTLVCDEDEIMESKVVSGVAYSRDEAKMTLVKVEDRPGIAAAIFGPLADAGVNVDMIVQNISELDDPGDKRAYTDMTFSCPTNQVAARPKGDRGRPRQGRSSPMPTWWSIPTSPRSRSWASGCAAMPASPPRCSPRWPPRT